MTGAGFVQALVFGLLGNPASTREELNQAAATVGMALTTQGLDKRFNARAVLFLDTLLRDALAQLAQSVPGASSLLARFPGGVWVMDSSSIGLPPALACVWHGNNGADDAAVKLAVQSDLHQGQLGLWLSCGRTHDQRTGVRASAVPAGSLRLADLGFSTWTPLPTTGRSRWISSVVTRSGRRSGRHRARRST